MLTLWELIGSQNVSRTGHCEFVSVLLVSEEARHRTATLCFTTSNRDGRGSARDGDDRILQFRP